MRAIGSVHVYVLWPYHVCKRKAEKAYENPSSGSQILDWYTAINHTQQLVLLGDCRELGRERTKKNAKLSVSRFLSP
jgi:hypothetical protein